ncbi:MAG: hypothetical protein M0D53_06050 [Flavobacterium sp. JAD_PAG50586_2]|nr:MAG: hypothetical protein M0D53_06050 [Flavobacterium sp. JAD_PAG50586_2]
MDSDYIIYRLKSTPYKFPTLDLLKRRLNNLDKERKEQILISLKKQLYAERNMDIQQQLNELVYYLPAS